MADYSRCVSSYYIHKYKIVASSMAVIAVGISFHVRSFSAESQVFLWMTIKIIMMSEERLKRAHVVR